MRTIRNVKQELSKKLSMRNVTVTFLELFCFTEVPVDRELT